MDVKKFVTEFWLQFRSSKSMIFRWTATVAPDKTRFCFPVKSDYLDGLLAFNSASLK
jgi:hypothetical protein